ncbi:MAG: 2Fe-2S iron-sulfur cluster-binding protein [Vicinamibacterales bacterium]
MLWEPASPSSVLALVTTVHLGLAALRNHRSSGRSPISSLTFVSLALAGAPWLFASSWGLALGIAVHAGWFAACEALGKAPEPAGRSVGPTAAPRPAASSADPVPTGLRAARGFVQTPVLATVDETPDIRTIRLRRPDGFDFEAGQFIPVRVRVDGKDYVRCYSISSSPHSQGLLEISVKRQGLVSNALHATARPGAVLSIKAPNGAFKYPAGDDRPIVLLAAGVGITPLMSMLRHAVHAEPARPVTLIYGSQDEQHLAFRDELLSVTRRHPQASVVYALSRQGASSPAFYPGRIDAALLKATVPDLVHSICFICGPNQMIDGVRATLATLGVPAPQIRSEVFEAAIAAAAGVREERVAAGRTGDGSRAAPCRAVGRGRAGGCTMRCLPADQTVAVGAGQSLLEAAESGGIEMPSLCRAGVCGTCRVRVTEGDVECESTTLDEADVSQGFVLACVAIARTNCTVQV